MWRDVVIGDEETQKQRGGSAKGLKLNEPSPADFRISENAREFWISGIFLRLGMTVGKNTPIGERVSLELLAGSSGDYISSLLLAEFLPRVNPERLVNAVKDAISMSYNEGRKDKAAEIQSALFSS
jgi:hypothetical protein